MNDDTLLLYYYNDGLSDRERQKIGQALAEDDALAIRYANLKREMLLIADEKSPALPADRLQRFHDTIDRSARRETVAAAPTTAPKVNFWSFFWGAAVTTALAIGIGIGIWFGDNHPFNQVPDAVTVATGPTSEHSAKPVLFQRSVRNYLRESEQSILTLATAADTDRVMLILNLIEQNRLFEQAAAQNNAPGLARVLRAFEPVLLQLAADDIAPEDETALRAQLAFELNVMLTKLNRETSDEQQPVAESTQT